MRIVKKTYGKLNDLKPLVVKVYWNLNKDCWSIQRKGKIIGYASSLLLANVKFLVSERGRQRVIREKRKNVHAYASGEVVAINKGKPKGCNLRISYNPYKAGWFYVVNTNLRIDNCSMVYCCNKVLIGKP